MSKAMVSASPSLQNTTTRSSKWATSGATTRTITNAASRDGGLIG
jgi:hypothetical protein